ncbi:hypothetical protein [Kribbella albertanoniae]|nr:hypothetical protein [Kribbella albertanoniae]
MIELHDQLTRQDETITPDGFQTTSRPAMPSNGNLVAWRRVGGRHR